MKKITFKRVYLSYVLLLIITALAALLYVNSVLHQYEECQPDKYIKSAVAELVDNAANGAFWSTYSMPEVTGNRFEKHLDIQGKYLSLFSDKDIEYKLKHSVQADELYYAVKNKEQDLAEIKLKARGKAVTKLAVLSFREWQIEYVKPLLEPESYTISVPSDFAVWVNDVRLSKEDGAMQQDEMITYNISEVYFEPKFRITDHNGESVKYTLDENQVIAEFYDYRLILPATLKVEVNGKVRVGEKLEENLVQYDIRQLTKPVVHISDSFGNVISYEGGDELPMTYMKVCADNRYAVKVAGKPVPEEVVTRGVNPEYDLLADFVEELPQISTYHIAVLGDDAEIKVYDKNGNAVVLDPTESFYDFTTQAEGHKGVPQEVSPQVDVLDIAQKWSLFMSNDLPFAEIEKHLIAKSYQHKVAVQYATGIDITFTSGHILRDPAFTDSSVTNFRWIAKDCFSVDISFVKHMVLRNGIEVDDAMKDRFYFVKYDDTNDNVDNPEWKIAGMKEILNHEK